MSEHDPVSGSRLIDPGPIEFEATLERSDSSGAACFVPFPFDLKQTYGKGNLVPIVAIFDGRVEYRGSLAKMGGAHALLIVRKDLLSELGKAAGDSDHVRVALDDTVRTITLGEDAREAIEAEPAAAAGWQSLSYSHQREYQLWIDDAKKPETRARRIAKAVAMLAEGKRLKS